MKEMTEDQVETLKEAISLLEDLDYRKEDFDLGSYNGKFYCGYCFCDLTFKDQRSLHKNCQYFELIEKLEAWIKNDKRAD